MNDPRLRLAGTAGTAEADQVLRALDSIRPIVTVPRGLPEPAAGAALSLLAILVRVFPHVLVDGTSRLGPNPWGIRDLAEAPDQFGGVRPLPATRPAADIRVTVGPAGGEGGSVPVLGVGGGDWTARLGWAPQRLDDEALHMRHGLGLHAAACLAAGELLKIALMPLGMRAVALPGAPPSGPGQPLVWNLVDYRLGPGPSPAPPAGRPRPLALALAGAGSVGTSAAAILCFCQDLSGDADVIDMEEFDPGRNPFRYPALTGIEAGPKAAWTAALLNQAGWTARPHLCDVAAWAAGRPGPGFPGILVSSVDDLAGRFDVADVLAREIVSAGVSGLAFHVQREILGDGWACPYCEYVPAAPPLTQAQVIAGQTGLPVERVIALQLPGALLTADDIAVCAGAGKISAQAASRLAGRRLADLIAGAYAEAAINPGQAGAARDAGGGVTVAAPQVSWLTGVIIAAELAKSASGLPTLDRRVDVDMSGLPQGFTRRVRADASGWCACASGTRRRWMLNLYGGRG